MCVWVCHEGVSEFVVLPCYVRWFIGCLYVCFCNMRVGLGMYHFM